ncbi:MAG: SDR family NAD(P)-dependent oxidoreductase, partial [Acidobacteria bacterium]|nr:SDR family NAD(P)-dependent oxidoreductase [Acidobacteriota bacterium]
MDNEGLGGLLADKVHREGGIPITVNAGSVFEELSVLSYIINPAAKDDYEKLFSRLAGSGHVPVRIVHIWNVTGGNGGELTGEKVRWAQVIGFYSLLDIARAIGKHMPADKIHLYVLTDYLHDIAESENACPFNEPGKATIIGALNVIPQEYTNISCRGIDIVLPKGGITRGNRLVSLLYDELKHSSVDSLVAYRGNRRWIQALEPVRLTGPHGRPPLLRTGGVYLITGGLGGMGLVLAEYLAKTLQAKLILTGRRPVHTFPGQLQRLEKTGAGVLYFQVDVTDLKGMTEVITGAEGRLGAVNGIIHTAGAADYAGIIHERSIEKNEDVFAPKIAGTIVLNTIFAGRPLDFFVLCSSLAGKSPVFGQVGYCAANAFQDAFANYKTLKDDVLTISIGWDTWQEVGMAAEAVKRSLEPGMERVLEHGIHPGEGIEVFIRALGHGFPYLAVSTRDLSAISVDAAGRLAGKSTAWDRESTGWNRAALDRSNMTAIYEAPATVVEKDLVEIWENFFGIEGIGIDDDFFELGGDSLKAMTVIGKVHRRMDVEIPLAVFFTGPTVKKLACHIDSSTKKTFTVIPGVEEREYYPLSSAQERLFILQQLEVANTAYNITTVLLFTGNIDSEKMAETFKKLIARHESLRTSFHMVDEKPVQRVHGLTKVLGSPETFFQKGSWPPEAFVQSFDLSQAPLLRIGIIENGPDSIMILDMHHIITDGLSMQVFVNDFMALYAGRGLSRLKLRYRDYAVWQRSEGLSGEKAKINRQAEYWLNEFIVDEEIPELNLPYDYLRPKVRSFGGARGRLEIEKPAVDALKKLALKEEGTLFMVLLAIFNILLAKLGGQEDIVIGVPAAGRRHPDLNGIIGMFVNTLALRNYPIGEKSFKEFLKEVKNRSLAAFENQDYPFEDLVNRLQVRRDTGRNPLFDVMFSLQDMSIPGAGKIEVPGLTLTPYDYETNTTRFDLSLDANEVGDRLLFSFTYSTKLFKAPTIERFARYFRELIVFCGESANLEVKLAEVELITEVEKAQVLNEFNNTAAEYPRDKTIHQLFAGQAAQT